MPEREVCANSVIKLEFYRFFYFFIYNSHTVEQSHSCIRITVNHKKT